MHKLRPFYYPILLFLLALILSISLWIGLFPDLIFRLRIDLGNILFILGLICAAAWAGLVFTWRRSQEISVESVTFEAADEKRRFLRRLDHELKNPLTAIRAGLANLAETHLDEMQRQALTSVEAQTLRLSRLSSDLRKLAELEARPLERTAVNVDELLH